MHIGSAPKFQSNAHNLHPQASLSQNTNFSLGQCEIQSEHHCSVKTSAVQAFPAIQLNVLKKKPKTGTSQTKLLFIKIFMDNSHNSSFQRKDPSTLKTGIKDSHLPFRKSTVNEQVRRNR